MENVRDTILSQYANSPVLLSLIAAFNDALDPTVKIDAFYRDLWDIDTASGYGLDVWGRIVGVSRLLTVDAGANFGLKNATTGFISGDPFAVSPFFFGTPASANYVINDDIYRKLILIKALANISPATISIYNRMLSLLFPGRGNAFVTDTGSMVIVLSFQFTLSAIEIAMLKQSGVFSPPNGVLFNVGYLPATYSFGFAEAGALSASFNDGVFFKGFI